MSKGEKRVVKQIRKDLEELIKRGRNLFYYMLPSIPKGEIHGNVGIHVKMKKLLRLLVA
jgi:hypothetical protein